MEEHHQPLPPPPSQSHHEIISHHNNNINSNTHHLQPTSSSSPPPQPPDPLPQLQSQSSRVVHIPLDQVYRVLPTNNNTSDQNSDHTSRHHRSFFSSTGSRIFLVFIFCILLLAIIACILYLSLNPRSPTFIIESLSLKYSSSQDHSDNYYDLITYNLSMEASNPNGQIGFYYLEGGSASLSYKKEEIAYGEPPEFYNGKKEIRVFNSSSESLSKVFAETVMKDDDDKNSKERIPLVVFIRVPVKVKLGKLKLWKMKMKITCDVSISVLSSMNIVDLGHQHCKSTIH